MAIKACMFLLASLLLVDLVRSNLEGCKCNRKIVNYFKKYWKHHGCPKDLLGYMKEMGQMNITRTTCGAYDCGVTHPIVNTTGEAPVFSFCYENGTKYIEKEELKEEECGVLVQKKSNGVKVYRYIIKPDNGCYGMVCYRCCNQAPCKNNHHLTLLEDYRRENSDPEAIKRAKKIADELGLKLETTYSHKGECCLREVDTSY